MKRYNSVYAGSYTKPHEMVEEKDGDWVWYEDVEEMVEAAKAVVAQWETPNWNLTEHTGSLIYRLRAAIAKAEGDNHDLPGLLPT